MKKRLSKALAAAGVASRRACEELIFDGRVSVNGVVVKVPQTMVAWNEDLICVDGQKLSGEERKVAYLLNKPRGFLCSNKTVGKNDRLVIDLFDDPDARLFTVGRLDKDTTGLLIVTNDGYLANQIIHPSSNIEKEYVAVCSEKIQPEHLRLLEAGTVVEDVHVRPLKVTRVSARSVSVVVAEGKKREVRILCADAGLEVLELQRVRLGGLRLPALPEGGYRELRDAEVELIVNGVGV